MRTITVELTKREADALLVAVDTMREDQDSQLIGYLLRRYGALDEGGCVARPENAPSVVSVWLATPRLL